MSVTRAVWSPDAVARNISSEEKVMSIMALQWPRKEICAVLKSIGRPLAESSSVIPPSSSPIATKEFAANRVSQFLDKKMTKRV